jgi:predicted alpha/beta-hydrolase family hydrolase
MTVRTPLARHLMIEGKDLPPLSAILMKPPRARACFVFAHGAGAGMTHLFMEQIATGLYDRGIATLRYQFPFMEKGSRRPDSPAVAHAAVRAAMAEARKRCRGMPIVAGGKSFGGRMASQAQVLRPLAGAQGLAFLGFPLHPPDKPSVTRADHLALVEIPMLFVQGTRDKLADIKLLRAMTKKLGQQATVHLIAHADHAFHVPARSGRTDAEVMSDLMDAFAGWIDRILATR